MTTDRYVIPGSARTEHLPHAEVAGDAPSDDPVVATVCLDPAFSNHTGEVAIEKFANEYHLSVDSIDYRAATVKLRGRVDDINRAFDVRLMRVRYQGNDYRGRQGEISVPLELKDIVTSVLGLDDRPQTSPKPKFMRGIGTGLWPDQVSKAYGLTGDGAGQVGAFISLGGGVDIADLSNYFMQRFSRSPKFVFVGIDGATNQLGSDADGENSLDACVAGGFALASTIYILGAPNTDAGYYNAYMAAIHGGYGITAVSSSWGSPERQWTTMARNQFGTGFAAAAAARISNFGAMGDDGAADGLSGYNVDYPAIDPGCTGCGGTRTILNSMGQAIQETVWNNGVGQGATGGGISTFFDKPDFQSSLVFAPGMTPMRCGPDWALNSDPVTGYIIRLARQNTVIGGTSAASPASMGATLVLNAQLKAAGLPPVGNWNALIYQHPEWFVDITQGNNNGYNAGPGYDNCTGMGRPRFDKILAYMLAAAPPVVIPPVVPVPPAPVPTPTPPAPVPAPALDSRVKFLVALGKASHLKSNVPAIAGDQASFSP